MLKPTFYMMVGLPGSGKSTFAKALQEDFDCAYLSTDDLVEELAKERGETYSEGFTWVIDKATQLFHQNLKEALSAYKNIIHDQTNLTVKKRKSILSQLPKKYNKICVVVECDDVERQERLANRPGKVIPTHIDISMQKLYEQPTNDEGWDYILDHDSSSSI